VGGKLTEGALSALRVALARAHLRHVRSRRLGCPPAHRIVGIPRQFAQAQLTRDEWLDGRQQLAAGPRRDDAVEDERMEVQIEVEGAAEALKHHNTPGAAIADARVTYAVVQLMPPIVTASGTIPRFSPRWR